ncbi:hypothetical protein LEP1GSC036_4429 [Leptospira weilii str. 2006001853]|uniref:Uncharacterized protein n=1 Tax=Leptospira weilii str. 2006001853 TaxID=1001589 RepID=A0A828Z5R3_9LEPT|nr:hypothetical protein LEP1GSC036_4429 [Leptospira weilii str. 2006001853]EMN46365.1 hypothetical protein LEP1GSC086_3083 [Leptospira weilii str. LNT 1234]
MGKKVFNKRYAILNSSQTKFPIFQDILILRNRLLGFINFRISLSTVPMLLR